MNKYVRVLYQLMLNDIHYIVPCAKEYVEWLNDYKLGKISNDSYFKNWLIGKINDG